MSMYFAFLLVEFDNKLMVILTPIFQNTLHITLVLLLQDHVSLFLFFSLNFFVNCKQIKESLTRKSSKPPL